MGVMLMSEQEKELRSIRGLLEQARERIDHILVPAAAVHMRWRCAGCGYIKHFTRPMPAHIAPPCPKCGDDVFEAASG